MSLNFELPVDLIFRLITNLLLCWWIIIISTIISSNMGFWCYNYCNTKNPYLRILSHSWCYGLWITALKITALDQMHQAQDMLKDCISIFVYPSNLKISLHYYIVIIRSKGCNCMSDLCQSLLFGIEKMST